MLSPPFKLNALPAATFGRGTGHAHGEPGCCESPPPEIRQDTTPIGRARLAQLDPHLHCSVIGTCLSTAELRKIMARFIEVAGATDLEIHHDAVNLASQGGDAAKALHKALDQRHAATVKTFASAQDPAALAAAWDDASRQGEIPGAYWALLTHRSVTGDLRQRAFGEVHMLSHLVGSANRADIRRLVALERENAALAERLEREQQRRQDLVGERDELAAKLLEQTLENERQRSGQRQAMASPAGGPDQAAIALHTERRERAEQAAAAALAEVARLEQGLDHLRKQAQTLAQELSAAENQLLELSAAAGQREQALSARLMRRRVLYVGGRPSTTPAIRDLVQRHGGEFLHHDGGLEDRKGLLAASVPKADLVVFPVDCIDHDSALNLKRLGERHGVPYLALRNASVASFAAALSVGMADEDRASVAARPAVDAVTASRAPPARPILRP